MNIIELLKAENARVSLGRKWIYWDESDEWVVFGYEYRARTGTEYYRGDSEEKAVEELLK